MTTLPDPIPGLVIRYAYLWRDEALRRREEGTKYRPAVVVLAATEDGGNGTSVLVAPITHRRPSDPDGGIAIPPHTRARLGLDADPSWIVVRELNRFQWPGPDLLPVGPGQWAYGHLPAGLFRLVRARLLSLLARGDLSQVRRTH